MPKLGLQKWYRSSYCEREIEDLKVSLEDEKDNTSHIGLRNVHHRLRIAFGRKSRVEIRSNAPQPGVSISLVFGKVLTADFSPDQEGHPLPPAGTSPDCCRDRAGF